MKVVIKVDVDEMHSNKVIQMQFFGCSASWADSSHLDTADTGAITVVGNLDVSVVTPGGVPGVLDEVVVLAVLGSVSDSKDTMVKLGSASFGV